jgi:hypothetical protein
MAAAAHVSATIYGTVQTFDRYNGGYQMTPYNGGPSYQSFPTGITRFIGVSPAETLNTFTINAIIEVIPTGLNIPSAKFATDSTLAALIAAAG